MKREILLAETHDCDIELLLHEFIDHDFSLQVRVFRDGGKLIEHLFSAAGPSAEASPCAILVNLKLPKLSGLEVLRRLKADSRTQHVPVYLLLGSPMEQEPLAQEGVQPDGYLVKPVRYSDFSRLLESKTPQLILPLEQPTAMEPAPVSLPSAEDSAEASRLAALREYGILDTLGEQCFDDLTLLAARICETPAAFISLVDEHRQWFKSRVGVPFCETPREISFCTHAIEQSSIFVVKDARNDPRFSDNPLVTGSPFIRFYAGAPLITPSGKAIGTICVTDSIPGSLSAQQADALTALSRQVVHLLELRLTLRELVKAGTERETAQFNLRKSEKQYRGVFEAVTEGLLISSFDGTIFEANPGLCQLLDYSPVEFLALKPEAWLHVDSVPVFRTMAGSVRLAQEFRGEARLIHRNGAEVLVEIRGTPIHYRNGPHLLIAVHDLTGRKQAEAALRQSEIQFRATFENAAMGVALVSPAGDYLKVNHVLQQLLGQTEEELQAMSFAQVTHAEDVPAILKMHQEMIEGRRDSYQIEKRYTAKNGSVVSAHLAASVVRDAAGEAQYSIHIVENVTEKKLWESQSFRAQRMDSLGVLTAGIAHDLNTVLTPILMSSNMLRSDLGTEESKKILGTIETCAKRGADLVRQLLVFGRGTESQRRLLQLNHIIRDVVNFAGKTFPTSLKSQTDCASSLWPVLGNVTQLHQVLLNLCVNARDAMPQGGTLTISAKNVELDDHYVSMRPEAQAGPHVMIRVADTGTGIPPELLERIFEPFFTTKEHGAGTGLGLSTVMGIIRGHGGFVTVQSQPGQGTEFTIALPAVPGEAVQNAERPVEVIRRGQGELILVVDDEAAFTDVSRRVLERHGYTVLTARDGIEALMLYAQKPNEIKAVITDLEMPFLDGFGLTRAVKRINPHAPLLIFTGHDHETGMNEKVSHLRDVGVGAVLTKPFTTNKLLSSIHELFQQSQAPTTRTGSTVETSRDDVVDASF